MKPSERILEMAREILATPGGPDSRAGDPTWLLAATVQALVDYLDEQHELDRQYARS